jgi:hypothetical protein
MLASLAFEPIAVAGLRVIDVADTGEVVPPIDPAQSALVEEIRRMEGAPVADPLLFRCVEVCGFAILGAGAMSLVSGLAALVS